MSSTDPPLDEEFLVALRRAAEELINPWPKGEPLGSLSTARLHAVREAAEGIVGLTKRATVQRRVPSRSTTRGTDDDLALVTPQMEGAVGVTLLDLADLFVLDSVKGFGPQKFRAMEERQVSPGAAVRDPSLLPIEGKTGDELRRGLAAVTPEDRQLAERRAARQLVAAFDLGAMILTYRHPLYPKNAYHSNNAIPVLYARGDFQALVGTSAVACVGSREIRPPYEGLQRAFAQHVAKRGATVVSGFALGADTVAHKGAVEAGGRTVCVLPCGLDRPFPPENKPLYADWVKTPGVVFVSEFPIGTGASAMTLRKRNKLIVAIAQGVLVGQSSSKGGAMNAYRFALEQHKPVSTFAPDGTPATSGNELISVEPKASSSMFPREATPKAWDVWLSKLF